MRFELGHAAFIEDGDELGAPQHGPRVCRSGRANRKVRLPTRQLLHDEVSSVLLADSSSMIANRLPLEGQLIDRVIDPATCARPKDQE